MGNIYTQIAHINAWANELVRQSVKKLSFDFMTLKTPYGSFGDLIVHLFDAVNIWSNRIEGISEKVTRRSLKDFTSIDELLKEWEESDNRLVLLTKKILEKDEFTKVISYQNFSGKEFNNPIQEIFLHLSNHGYQHRGQLAMLLRLHEKEPTPQLDAIGYFRSLKN